MKIPDEVKAQITAYGYRKRGNSFWKIKNGFYKLINFQTGAYGDYFFINVALHPEDMPVLSQRCEPVKNLKESQCVLRWRVEQIAEGVKAFGWKIGFSSNAYDVQALLAAVIPETESWLNRWGAYETILSAGFDKLLRSFSAVPILWRKQFLLLKSYCAFKRRDKAAAEYFSAYLNENLDMNFSYVDNYMKETLNLNSHATLHVS